MAQSRDPLVEALMRRLQNEFWIVKSQRLNFCIAQLATIDRLCVREERIAEVRIIAHIYVLDYQWFYVYFFNVHAWIYHTKSW